MRKIYTKNYLVLTLMIIAVSLVSCKGYRTQKPGGKDRFKLLHIGEDGLEVDDDNNLSPFSLTEGIEGNFFYEEIAGCSGSDCQYKGYARLALYAEPLNFDALLLEKMKNDKVKTKNLDLSVLAGPYLEDVTGKAYSKDLMKQVQTESQSFSVGRSKAGYKAGQTFYDTGKELAELPYNPNDVSNVHAFTYKNGDVIGTLKFNLYTPIKSPMFSRTAMQTIEQGKDFDVSWESTEEGIIQMVYECKDDKGTPYALIISQKDKRNKYTISKDHLKHLPKKCIGACKICRKAPQTIEDKNGWGNTCVGGDFKTVEPKA